MFQQIVAFACYRVHGHYVIFYSKKKTKVIKRNIKTMEISDLVISDLLMMNAKRRMIVNYDKDEKEWTSQSLHMQEGSNREGWREIVKKATDVEPCMLMERLYLCTPPSNILLFTLCTSGLR